MKKYFAVLLSLACMPVVTTPAEVPQLLSYQGRLIQGTNLYNGRTNITFRLYDDLAGGTLLYTDTGSVSVVDGLYSTFIGDGTSGAGNLDQALYNKDAVYVEVRVGTNVMAPRERLASVAYALRFRTSGIANSNGNDSCAIIAGATNTIDISAENCMIGGGYGNSVYGKNSAIVGAYSSSIFRRPDVNGGNFIGGGMDNHISTYSMQDAICGGSQNRIWSNTAACFIGGGNQNEIGNGSLYCAIVGGQLSEITNGADYATSIGGGLNHISTNFTVAIGSANYITNPGCILLGDGAFAHENRSDRANQIKMRAQGGVYLTVGSSGLYPAGLTVAPTSGNSVAVLATQTSSDSSLVVVNKGSGPLIKAFAAPDGSYLAFIVQSNGVGIGRTPTAYPLEVEGTAFKTFGGSGWVTPSDSRVKTDVRDIKDALDTLDQLRPVQFRYTADYLAQHPCGKDNIYYHFIAQEYAEVFPQDVTRDPVSGYLSIDSSSVTPHLVAAVKELRAENTALRQRLEALENRIAEKH